MSSNLSELTQEACEAANEAEKILSALGKNTDHEKLDSDSPGQILYRCADAANEYYGMVQRLSAHKKALDEECKICADAYKKYHDITKKANISFGDKSKDFNFFTQMHNKVCSFTSEGQQKLWISVLRILALIFGGFIFGYYYFSYKKPISQSCYKPRKNFCINKDIF